jgi:hypothetical protein
VLVRTKLTALAVFVAGFALGLSIIPAIVHPTLVGMKFDIGISGALRLMTAQAFANLAAGACGFLAVLALRETIRAVLGDAKFRRVSAALQAALVMLLVTAFLLTPGLVSGIGRQRLDDSARRIPPLWFLGLQETIAGDVIDRAPREPLPASIQRMEDEATERYRRARPIFVELSTLAVTALASIGMLAVAAFLWNSRKLPAPVAMRRPARHVRALRAGMKTALVAGRHPISRAGFLFARRALSRSASHRVTMMASAAVGIAAAAVMLHGVDTRRVASSLDTSVLAIQLVLIAAVLTGFRQALRVPAELRANWSLQLAWPGDERRYLIGVKRAALFGLGLPLLVILAPLHVLTLGPGVAAVHFLFGLLLMLVGLELTTIGLRKPPFASTYVPGSNLKVVAAFLAPAVIISIYVLASIEHRALGGVRGIGILLGVFLLLWVGLRALDAHQRRRQRAAGEPVEWDELPSVTQRMDLSG